MTDAVALTGCLIVLAGVCWKLRTLRGTTTGAPVRHLFGCAVSLGGSLAVLSPATTRLAGRTGPFALWTAPAGQCCNLAAMAFLALVARSAGAEPHSRETVRRQLAGTSVVMVAGLVAYLCAGVTREGRDLVAADGREGFLAAYNILLTLHTAWCLTVFIVLIRRHSRYLGSRRLRGGLGLITASAALGLLWTVWSLGDVLSALSTGREDGCESTASALTALACLTLGLGGTTSASWWPPVAARVHRAAVRLRAWHGYRWIGPPWSAAHQAAAGLRHLMPSGRSLPTPGGWLRAWHGYRRIGPLWTAMHAALPEISLTGPALRLGLMLPLGARFALYRRIIEIRDGHLALRPYFHPEVAAWTAEAEGADLGTDAERLAPIVEAATIAAALEAARAGRRSTAGGCEAYVPPQVRASVEAETAWLIQVSDAFVGSPAVELVRARVRAGLGAGPGGSEPHPATLPAADIAAPQRS
ncbi:MAB_1171c family putative transporter [Streptomyces sp. NPDC006733]|uniref:MAB_1171c family putative transporter n=1 Tax=Streptomyces sp. NPDC006733 TaxID=3155460 RepID=UPI0033F62474